MKGYAQSTDLAEHLTQIRDIDYRTAYFVVGDVVRNASGAGILGSDLTAQMINRAAAERTGANWGLRESDLQAVLDPAQIVASRQAPGGAARAAVEQMLHSTVADAAVVAAGAAARLEQFRAAEDDLIGRVRNVLDTAPASGQTDRASGDGDSP